MLELTPPSAPGSGRVSVFVMEPGGSLWLFRNPQERPGFQILLVPRRQLPRFRDLLAAARPGQDLRLVRSPAGFDRPQRLTLPAGDVDRVREAIRELWRFEGNPELPEWKERGYHTEAETAAWLEANVDLFDDEPGPAGPGEGV